MVMVVMAVMVVASALEAGRSQPDAAADTDPILGPADDQTPDAAPGRRFRSADFIGPSSRSGTKDPVLP